MLKVGDMAPDFSLPDQNEQEVCLSDFKGKKILVVFFYPKDFTPGCTAESCSFRDASEDFSSHNAQIVGISQDDAASHQEFSAKHLLPYPLLSDKDNEVAKSFGVKKSFGLFAGRATFVIDRKGVIQMAFSSQLNVNKHVHEALKFVAQLNG